MRNKIKILLGCCLALLLLGSGKAWGQTQTYWNSGCNCSDPYLGPYYPTCNYAVRIDGNRYWNWSSVSLQSLNTANPMPGNPGGGYCTLPQTYYPTNAYWIGLDGIVHYTYYTATAWATPPTTDCDASGNNPGSGSYCCNNGVPNWIAQTSNIDTIRIPCSDWPTTLNAGNHSHTPIDVYLSRVQDSIQWFTPTWTHTQYTSYNFDRTTGARGWNTATPDGPNNVTEGIMNVHVDGLRLTGANRQIARPGNIPTATLTFTNTNRKLYFDQAWNGNFNGVISNWVPWTDSVKGGQAIGFLSSYIGSSIPVIGGEVALGPNCNLERNLTIETSNANILVDAYKILTNYCDPPTNSDPEVLAHDVGYRVGPQGIATTTVDDNDLRITNTIGGCYAVDFCPIVFEPIFTGNGNLLIDPNVTNFNAGATFNTVQNGNVTINSHEITNVGNFLYSSAGSGNLLIDIGSHQTPRCDDCGFFDVSGNFITTILPNGSSNIFITNQNPLDTGHVHVAGRYTHNGGASANTHSVDVKGWIQVDSITYLDANTDNMSFISRNSWIKFGKDIEDTFRYVGKASTSSLFVHAQGECDEEVCGESGGFVKFSGFVKTSNEDAGGVTIWSDNSFIEMADGFDHQGKAGDLFVYAPNSAVHILGPVNDPASFGNLVINRDSTGRDSIIGTRVRVEGSVTYTQTTDSTYNGLFINGIGAPCVDYCGYPGGFVWLQGFVTTKNMDHGHVRIVSDQHYVSMDSGFVHEGVHGNMTVKGYTYVDVKKPFPDNPTANGIVLPGLAGVNEGVFINRIGVGKDSIWSHGGSVMVEYPLTYNQVSDSASNTNGFDIFAMGPCTFDTCLLSPPTVSTQRGGYVWLKSDVNTTNDELGTTTIKSMNHYVRIGLDTIDAPGVDDWWFGRFTHTGMSGDMNILTLGEGTCDTGCITLPENHLWVTHNPIDTHHEGRSYIWIGNDVNIKMDGTDGEGYDGNATIRSYVDVVHFADSVTFSDTNGSNFLVSGEWGIRTYGPTALTNNTFNPSGKPDDTQNSSTTGYRIPNNKQGFVTYLSQRGYVDFGYGTEQISDVQNKYNTPFIYTGDTTQNALLIEGYRRVYFGDSVTIKMDLKQSGEPTLPGGGPDLDSTGNAKIFSPYGWIAHRDTVEFTGFNGNFITYANGPNVGRRSCWEYYDVCDIDGGFVMYDSIFKINYIGQGVTWIRSNSDDVYFGDTVTYQNFMPFNPEFGEIVIQAGQDIYGRNHNQGFIDAITIDQKGNKSILFEAKNTIHLEQNLFVTREGANTGDITFKAGYPTFSSRTLPLNYEFGETVSSHSADYKDLPPSAEMDNLTWDIKGSCPFPYNYLDRFPCDIHQFDMRPYYNNNSWASRDGGDIWLEAHTLFDLTTSNPLNNTIQTTLRAHKSIFIDSTFLYRTNVAEGGDVLLFAETGNVEAAVTRQNKADFRTNGYIADDSIVFNIENVDFNAEIRIQAGNRVWTEGDINSSPVGFDDCWSIGCAEGAEFNGNILLNKPFYMHNMGKGQTLLSAARDIETQIMAPVIFDFDNSNHIETDSLTLTAGRHIETHAMMQFNYNENETRANITLQAGRLNRDFLAGDSMLCKATEVGTTLTDSLNLEVAFDPDVKTGGEEDANKNNTFAEGGKGNGSILIFDSLEFNYNGAGKIYLVALNGNIESDPYLHRKQNEPANPGMGGLAGNFGDGYIPYPGWSPSVNPPAPIQHDAQITFNHGGSGVTQLKAIDIKLHDKIAYYTNAHLTDNRNGQFYMTAYDSILTRNIEYVNPTDTGSVFITTAKYKDTRINCASDYCSRTDSCGLDNIPIYQGHIVLGYGADRNSADDAQNMNDSIVFNFSGNPHTQGANVYILAGYEGYDKNVDKGTRKTNLFTTPEDRGKGYGGNITFDFMKLDMARGNHTAGGYLEISTPNGNIWGKDSIVYHGFDGDIKVDAGVGSKEDYDAIRWDFADVGCAGGTENTLNTNVPDICSFPGEWRTGNIMMKGAYLNFQDGLGNATFRTREGFIDMYDAVTVEGMRGDLLFYAGTNNAKSVTNYWGDVSLRDFLFSPVENSGSVFIGADDNIMLNYGYSNDNHTVADGYHYYGRGLYDISIKNGAFTALSEYPNPYYWTTYKQGIDANRAVFNVNEDGYLWYQNLTANQWMRKYHKLYRGCSDSSHGTVACSGFTGLCETVDNYARPLMFDFSTDANNNPIATGGLAVVATNYIDMFTKFTFFGGDGAGLASVPGMTSLRGEPVAGYGLYMKSIYDGQKVEKRRLTCEDCGQKNKGYQIGGGNSTFDLSTYEWTYIGFHDDARIHTNSQKSLIEAPIVEFFGHAELDAYHDRGTSTKLTVKTDSLIFHDSAVFSGAGVELLPYTTDADLRDNDMRYGVINDRGKEVRNYLEYGLAIEMPDRQLPVIEFGYQRCNEPLSMAHSAPNLRSVAGLEATPRVGGDIIVAFKYDFTLPILNSVVANHARISFMDDLVDGVGGGEFIDACIRTDLLRIRNKVEFFTDPNQLTRRGTIRMTSNEQMPSVYEAGIFPHHLHMEPGSELSIPGEDSLIVISTTTVGGYGEIHENINVLANGIVAPGYASLMEYDCQTGYPQGRLSIHNLYMEKDAVIRISIGTHDENCRWNPDTNERDLYCTQTDTLYVQDSVFFFGRIALWVMPETDYIEPGCYLFFEYNDLKASVEYVNNLVLMNPRHGEYYFALDKSEPGRVYLCVTTTPTPIIQRYIHIHEADGVTTDPVAEIYHYVPGHNDFVFTATYANKIALEVLATGYYSQKTTKLPSTYLFDGTHQYRIRQVVEPYDVYFGGVDDMAGVVGNYNLLRQRVWAYRNTLFINAEKEDVVSIYNVTGVLFQKLEIPTGLKKLTLERGVYIVTLKDGSVHKIIIN